jgi:twitching motility protein PilT
VERAAARAVDPVPAARAPAAPQAPVIHHAQPRLSFRPTPEESPLAEFVRADIPVEAPKELRTLLAKARAEAASDVHVMAGQPVRFRRNGRLEPFGETMSEERVNDLLMPLLNARNAKQLSELGYADFACPIEGAGRLRVNVNKQRTGLKGCFRLIMAEPPALESLGLPHELRQMLNYHQGLVVVSGPNGAGKTTTLAALVDLFNSERSVHIITVEDPVEVMHPIKKAIVSQREVGSHTKSFHAALKGSLREDPDVIAIGELRDRETVEKALEAAETGHLVFATMSTPSGASTIDRLIDMFPPDDQSQVRATLAGALKFVVSQRLVPRKDGDGQVVAVELLTGGMALWTLIRDDKLYQLPSLLQRGRGFGMIRIEDSLNELLASGTISMETAKLYADDPRALGEIPAGNARPQAPPERGKKGSMRNLLSKKGR